MSTTDLADFEWEGDETASLKLPEESQEQKCREERSKYDEKAE
jgi:hypothetical protein